MGAGYLGGLTLPCPQGSPWMALKERKVWVQENAELNLSCEASGHPQPTISWNVNGSVSRLASSPHSLNPCPGLEAVAGDASAL